MSMTQNDLLKYLNSLLKPELFEDYAPNGLQVSGSEELSKIAFAVSATQESLNEAINWGAKAIVVHHGIFWKYQGPRTITGAWGERVKLCVKNDLNLFAYHLPLDSHPEIGNAAALAEKIGMNDLAPFALYKKQPMGIKGKLNQAVSAQRFKEHLTKVLGHDILLATPDETKNISSVGIITGGANNDWVKAMEDALDAYITGEISEYNWHDAKEAGIHYFAGGHHATEKFGIQALMNKIKKDFNSVEVKFFDSLNPA